MNRTATNEAVNRRNLLSQRFTAVGGVIASGALGCVAGISAGVRGEAIYPIKQHAGLIEVDTRPGEFTEFKVILPRMAATGNAGTDK